jgi:pseudouridine-5'-phosphate glycosidase
MVAAAHVGIRVFATGGIGGVHRGAEHTFDISADLEELARTDVAVVCAGAKSVLDIGLTLEYLETVGVPVFGYRTDDFPAFYTPTSGFPVPHRVESPAEIARVIDAKRALGLAGGTIVANPIDERYALDPVELERITSGALTAAQDEGVTGKHVTPFLLAAIHKATGGASEEANRQLVYDNVRLAARIAAAL